MDRRIATKVETAEFRRQRAPLTTVLILVTVAATLSGRSVVMSTGGSDSLPRCDRRQLVETIAQELERDLEPTGERPATAHLSRAPRFITPSIEGLPLVLTAKWGCESACCLRASADWHRRLTNLPPPRCA